MPEKDNNDGVLERLDTYIASLPLTLDSTPVYEIESAIAQGEKACKRGTIDGVFAHLDALLRRSFLLSHAVHAYMLEREIEAHSRTYTLPLTFQELTHMPDEKKEFRRLRGLYRKETVHAHHSDISEDDWERVSVIAGGAISAERLRARLQHDSVRHEMRKILMNTPPPEEQEASLQQLRVAVEDLAAASHPRRMQGELEAQSRGSRKKFGKIRRKRDRAHADYCDTFDALPLRSRLGWRLMPFSESLIDSTRRQSVQAFVSIVNRLPTVEENREIVDDYTRLQLIARQAHQRLVHDTLSWR